MASAKPHGIFCRQHSYPGSNILLPRKTALRCFVVDERQVGRSPCLLQGFKEQRRLTNVLLALATPARQCVGGWRL